MLHKEFRISKLIAAYLQGTLSPAEEAELNDWINTSAQNRAFFNNCLDEPAMSTGVREYHSSDRDRLWTKTIGKIRSSEKTKMIPLRTSYKFLYKVAAAILLMTISFGAWFYFQRSTDVAYSTNIITPGIRTATLTLANGKKIILSEAVNGELAKEAGISITKTAEGKLIYQIEDLEDKSNSPMVNTLSTARGETYQVVLPDGTNVWLNSFSTLKYSPTFARLVTRKVELSGEAYFEVAKDTTHPFVVLTEKQEVEVLGTHFNVNAYTNEPAIKTTLLEGVVKVSQRFNPQTKILRPGQQSVNDPTNQKILVRDVNTEEEIAWTLGDFVFHDDIRTIMRQIARWYNVEISYQGEIPQEAFVASIPRSKNIDEVLKALELTKKIHFKIEGRKIIVMPNFYQGS